MDSICAAGKSIQGLSDAARIRGSQHPNGHKIYLVSMFLFLFNLSNQLFYEAICCWAYLLRYRRSPELSLSHLTPSAEDLGSGI